MIPQAFIQDLLGRVDVVDVVGKYVKLKKAGANLLGLCPFHGEKSPSFTVSPTKQFYHCFGCGAHGSAIGFLMEFSGLSYVDAIKDLAQATGVQVPQESGPQDSQALARNQDVAQVLEAAMKFYRSRLKDAPQAIDYLKRRGLTGAVAARFGIGYAPDSWRGLEAAVNDYASESLTVAGLVIEQPAQEGNQAKRYDRFRDRIMFPIRTMRGQVIGFGGRILERGEPKYLNSPETPLFTKGRELYGLFEARQALRDKDCAIVVEGYMDVVMLAQHGIDYAVATLGTATTPDHLRKLLRLVERVVFCFDGDKAGRKAAWRALEASLPFADDAKRIDFLFLPPEHDPDTYVQEQGRAEFEALLGRATTLSQFLLAELAQNNDLNNAEGRARLIAQARPLLHQLPPAALRMQIEHELASLSQLRLEEVQKLIGDAPPPASRPEFSEAKDGSGAGRSANSGAAGAFSRSAMRKTRPPSQPELLPRVIALLASHPGLALEVSDELLDPQMVSLLGQLRQVPANASWAAVTEAVASVAPEMARMLETRALGAMAQTGQPSALGTLGDRPELEEEEARQELSDAVRQMQLKTVEKQYNALSASMAQGQLSADDKRRLLDLQGLMLALRKRAAAPN